MPNFSTIFILIIILIIVALFYARQQLFLWYRRIKKETEEAEDAVDSAFDNLKKKIEKEIEFMDNEPGLSKEEKEIRDRLEDALSSSSETIKKELEDIKKTID